MAIRLKAALAGLFHAALWPVRVAARHGQAERSPGRSVARAEQLLWDRLPDTAAPPEAEMGAIFGLTEAELRREHALWTVLADGCSGCHRHGACPQVRDRAARLGPPAVAFCARRVCVAEGADGTQGAQQEKAASAPP